jgi:hypothetical protein
MKRLTTKLQHISSDASPGEVSFSSDAPKSGSKTWRRHFGFTGLHKQTVNKCITTVKSVVQVEVGRVPGENNERSVSKEQEQKFCMPFIQPPIQSELHPMRQVPFIFATTSVLQREWNGVPQSCRTYNLLQKSDHLAKLQALREQASQLLVETSTTRQNMVAKDGRLAKMEFLEESQSQPTKTTEFDTPDYKCKLKSYNKVKTPHALACLMHESTQSMQTPSITTVTENVVTENTVAGRPGLVYLKILNHIQQLKQLQREGCRMVSSM